ncbi:helix-turn-helix domain-containing protein [Bathymodiolus thermophilus thioautotrophic gill symbiont]|uniref:HTH cro/C1-type domain-containing protein n=1 Tax=Bathymodiolus thermophilus thioautotrophic gill symbiont TaxID=2360 RepID=A0A1J5TXI1_9GAMM|nr:helix-turn-helix transcriptional regulator [Bathymodiolus thermophilus thioautotrophic gill symbiont]OIR25512.1 hypothetical protein BGC33_06875 [Bathymodiolus thermophilus thioautotrophic gill symbiont]
MKKSNEIANKIKSLREISKLSQSELAKRAGVTSSAISMIESGQRLPSLVVTKKISEAFNMTVSELTGEKVSKNTNNKAQIFFRKYSELNDLGEADQKIIKNLIKSLKDKK